MFCASHGKSGYKIGPKSKHRPRNTATTVGKKGSSVSLHSDQMHVATFQDMAYRSQSSTNSAPGNTPSALSTLFNDGYMEPLLTTQLNLDGVHIYVAKVRPFMKIKMDEGKECYDLWFILEENLKCITSCLEY